VAPANRRATQYRNPSFDLKIRAPKSAQILN
jgi:hypothetical protein